MTTEYLPVGIACNLKCGYCYQDPMRDAGNISVPRNWEKAKENLKREFTVFGGEPLLAPIEHLHEVFAYGLENFGRNSIQTNGVLITDAHIEMFQKYKVGVGISIDGSGELNSVRSSLQETDQTLGAIAKLCDAGLIPSLIITLHRENAGPDRIRQLVKFIDSMMACGVSHFNFHILEREQGKEHLALNDDETIFAFQELYNQNSRAQPFLDIYNLLTDENPKVSCIWNHCDPLTTDAVQGVGPDGEKSNCGRVNKDGVNWVKADTPGSERYSALYNTPQEHGGCKDCRFFFGCKGQCPGTAIDGDWRNRTRDCQIWYHLFEMIEKEILLSKRMPVTRNLQWLRYAEKKILEVGSHGDSPHQDSPHGDAHGDSPHIDVHGDSTLSSSTGVAVTWKE